MPDIYVYSGDANMRMNNEATWTAARDASTAETIDTTTTAYSAGIREARLSSIQNTVRRYYLAVDTSGISIKPESATLKIYGYTNTGGILIAVKVNQAATGDASTDFIASDFGEIDFTTPYSDEFTGTWSTTGYNEFALNDAALTEMLNFDSIKIAVIGHDHDYLDVTPTNGFTRTSGFYPATATDANTRPLISYVEGTPPPVVPSGSFAKDYTINTYNIEVLSVQYDKDDGVDQVPFFLGVPGPARLRGRENAPITSTGKKKN